MQVLCIFGFYQGLPYKIVQFTHMQYANEKLVLTKCLVVSTQTLINYFVAFISTCKFLGDIHLLFVYSLLCTLPFPTFNSEL